MTSQPPDDSQAQGMPDTSGTGQAEGRPDRWLRRQRQARGWLVTEMACQLREAARVAGDSLPAQDVMVGMIRRWERGWGVSERYQLPAVRSACPPASTALTSQTWPRPGCQGHRLGRPSEVAHALPIPRTISDETG